MTDIWTPEKRSEVMSRIRGHDTKPERQVRSLFHQAGYRFTVNGPKNKELPGRPDLVLPKYRAVVFVHGCFWHGHENCPDFRIPSSRREYWVPKIEGNRARDERVQAQLLALGWHVVTIWACSVKNRAARAWLRQQIPKLVGPPPAAARTPSTRYGPDEGSGGLAAAEEERPYQAQRRGPRKKAPSR